MNTSTTLPRRRFLSLVAAGGAAAALGSACSGDDSDGSGAAADLEDAGDPTQASGELDVWVLDEEALNPVSQASLDRFFGATDVKANLVIESNETYRDVLQTVIDQDERPDILFNWGGGSIRSYVQAGLLEDLTPYFEEYPEFQESFIQSVLDAGKIDDGYYGIPMRTMQPKLMFYNTAVLDEAGLSVPSTWQDFLDAVDTLSAAGVTPVAVGAADQWPLLMWFEYLTDRIGGEQVFLDIAAGSGDGWQHPAVAEAVGMISDLVDRGAFGTAFASVTYDNSGPLLTDGKAAMMLSGSWEYTNFVNDAPDFVANSFEWGAFPPVDGGEGNPDNVAGNPTNYFSVHADSELKEVAINYLREEMGSEEYVTGLLDIGDIPAVAGIEEHFEGHEHQEYFSFVYNMAANAPSFQLSWDQAIDRPQAEPMLEAMANVFLGKLDAEGFVQANEDAAA